MKLFSSQQKNTAEQGFTIVEVLISLTIFSIAVAGVITVAAQGGLNVNAAKDKLTATYLADEGIELMRALRDTHVVAEPSGSEAAGWTAFIGDVSTRCTIDAPCDIDATDSSGSGTIPFPSTSNVITCGGPGTFCPLYYNSTVGSPDEGFYQDFVPPGLLPVAKFSRSITISPSPTSSDEMVVTSSVTWKEGALQQTITQRESIFNWY
jgi:prepilin-type N-terminal cleavage/methylation domain-containing protein